MLQIINIYTDIWAACCNAFCCRYQIRTHSAGKGYRNMDVLRFGNSCNSLFCLFPDILSRAGSIVQCQNKGIKFMTTWHPMETHAQVMAICIKNSDGMLQIFIRSFYHFRRNLIAQGCQFGNQLSVIFCIGAVPRRPSGVATAAPTIGAPVSSSTVPVRVLPVPAAGGGVADAL